MDLNEINIYIYDTEPDRCARQCCDTLIKHLYLDYGRILATVCWYWSSETEKSSMGLDLAHIDSIGGLLDSTHPIVEWAAACSENWLYLYELLVCVIQEHQHRFGTLPPKYHNTWKLMAPLSLPNIEGGTPFLVGVPVQYLDAYQPIAYRMWFCDVSGVIPELAKWTNREQPAWLKVHKFINSKL